jgi:phospholipase/lecithinase/hemolysin
MLQALGINVIGVDVNSLINSIIANPGAYGFTNVTSACMAIAGCNPNTYLWWDTEHPTTYADSLVANLAYNDLNPTPEPSSITLLTLGAVFGCWVCFRRYRAPQFA